LLIAHGAALVVLRAFCKFVRMTFLSKQADRSQLAYSLRILCFAVIFTFDLATMKI